MALVLGKQCFLNAPKKTPKKLATRMGRILLIYTDFYGLSSDFSSRRFRRFR